MGCKPWLKVGTLLLGGMLLCGCQDPPLRNSGLSRTPDPNLGKSTTGPGAGAPGNVSGWNPNGAGVNNTSSATLQPQGAGGPGAFSQGAANFGPNTNSPAGVNSQIQPPANPLSGPAPLGARNSEWAVGNGNSPPPISGPSAPPLPNSLNNAPFTPGLQN